jgi:HNH endonuclease.
VTRKFPKDAWIIDAIKAGYIIPRRDGSILRAVSADDKGNVDKSKGYREIKQQIHKKSGRVYFNMSWRGFTKSVLVNRVIALRFHPNPDRLPQVNHIDGNKENNAADNLEWASGSDNEKHAHRTGLKTGRGSANSNAKLTADDVAWIRAHPEISDHDCAARFGVARSTIVNIRKGKTWTHL